MSTTPPQRVADRFPSFLLHPDLAIVSSDSSSDSESLHHAVPAAGHPEVPFPGLLQHCEGNRCSGVHLYPMTPVTTPSLREAEACRAHTAREKGPSQGLQSPQSVIPAKYISFYTINILQRSEGHQATLLSWLPLYTGAVAFLSRSKGIYLYLFC